MKKTLFSFNEFFFLKKRRKKLSPEDFDPVNIIGRGAFGEVRLCKWKETGEIVVIKKMKKSEMVFKNQVAHIRAERDILATANNPWIVELKCSFQVNNFDKNEVCFCNRMTFICIW